VETHGNGSPRFLAAVLVTASLVLTFPTQAEVYKWTDAQGVLHFSDKPPADGNADQVRLRATNSYRSAIPADTIPQASAKPQRPAKAQSVVMFSAEWCGYCRKARAYFQANRVAFRERDVDKDPAARREYQRLGGTGLPLILVGEQRLSGFSEEAFRRLFEN
jgi:glutaredoxin